MTRTRSILTRMSAAAVLVTLRLIVRGDAVLKLPAGSSGWSRRWQTPVGLWLLCAVLVFVLAAAVFVLTRARPAALVALTAAICLQLGSVSLLLAVEGPTSGVGISLATVWLLASAVEQLVSTPPPEHA